MDIKEMILTEKTIKGSPPCIWEVSWLFGLNTEGNSVHSLKPFDGVGELTYNSSNSTSVIPKIIWPSFSAGYTFLGAPMGRCALSNASRWVLMLCVAGMDIKVALFMAKPRRLVAAVMLVVCRLFLEDG